MKTGSPSFGAVDAPFEMRRRRDRLAVLVKPHEGAIEVVAREVEIVRIAAEERHLLFRREDEPHIGIFAVGVELVLAALIERDDLAAELRFAAGAAFLLDRRDLGVARLDEILSGLALARIGDARGHIGDAVEHFGLHAGAELLVLACRGGEAVLHIVDLVGGKVLRAAANAMMVGQHHAILGDDRGRAAGRQAHRGAAHIVEPRLVDIDAVFRLHRRGGEIVEGPHAFIGERAGGRRRRLRRQAPRSDAFSRCPSCMACAAFRPASRLWRHLSPPYGGLPRLPSENRVISAPHGRCGDGDGAPRPGSGRTARHDGLPTAGRVPPCGRKMRSATR